MAEDSDKPLCRVLGVFAKWPSPGAAKSRLAPGDPALGARIARAFLDDVLGRLGQIEARRILAIAPAGARPQFAAIAAGRFGVMLQADGDLGQRLSAFFSAQIAAGARAVVAVGSDSPTLPSEYVDRAFDALRSCDVVLGPATDGGYYLVGCGARLPPIFDGVDWGSSRVLAQSVARLNPSDWRLAVLPPWYDVDRPDDWSMLAGHIAAMRRAGMDPGVPHTEALVAEVGGIIERT